MGTKPTSLSQASLALLLRHRRLLGAAAFLLVFLAAFEFSGLRAHFNLPFLQQQLAAHQILGLLTFVLLFSLGNLIQIPGWLFLAAAVLTLGQMWGGLATYIAACISCMLTFFTIRWLGGDALRKLEGKFARKLIAGLDRFPIRSVVLLRTLMQTAPMLNYALAMSGVSTRNYLLGTLIGLPLPIAAYCLFFEQIAGWLHLH